MHPFPGDSGQQQRVLNTLVAVRDSFRTTFLTVAAPHLVTEVRARLAELVDDPIVLPSRYRAGLSRWVHRARGLARTAITGLKFSNYLVDLDLDPARVAEALEGRRFDCALFEYWHAVRCVPLLRARGTPCVLDMHDVLWRAYERHLEGRTRLPARWRRWAISAYARREEDAWREFAAIVTINSAELEWVETRVGPAAQLIHAPMGLDLERWPFSFAPASPPRVAFYGGLAGQLNQEAARACHEDVMPRVRRERSDAELWVIGSQPPEAIRAWERAPGVRVTGFVADPRELLGTCTVVLCPWRGRFGFRSRIAEVMALGVPVVASADAVHGMELEPGRGLILADEPDAMAAAALHLIGDAAYARQQSALARRQVEDRLGFSATYGHLAAQLLRLARGERCATLPAAARLERTSDG